MNMNTNIRFMSYVIRYKNYRFLAFNVCMIISQFQSVKIESYSSALQ